jgi:hypothetical protein
MDMNRGEFSYTVIQIATLLLVYKVFIRFASRPAARLTLADSHAFKASDLPGRQTST